ncbi:HAD family hydrolase [Sphingomonas sp.]|uniref:HAD family hydrolase n=1 Tax=Sphingomonas sp. TaxID=28214 RepID=UPI003B008AE2
MPDRDLEAPPALAARGGTGIGRPALFLDRDGVINVDTGYPHRPEELAFTSTAIDGVRLANEAGCLVIVATNQSGVSRGLFGLEAVDRFHDAIRARMAAAGARIDAIYSCPYHPDGTVAAFRADHEDRKPRPGMLLRAMREWPIDRARSLMVGDKPSDLAAAEAAGVAAILVPANSCDLGAVVATWLGRIGGRAAA